MRQSKTRRESQFLGLLHISISDPGRTVRGREVGHASRDKCAAALPICGGLFASHRGRVRVDFFGWQRDALPFEIANSSNDCLLNILGNRTPSIDDFTESGVNGGQIQPERAVNLLTIS